MSKLKCIMSITKSYIVTSIVWSVLLTMWAFGAIMFVFVIMAGAGAIVEWDRQFFTKIVNADNTLTILAISVIIGVLITVVSVAHAVKDGLNGGPTFMD